MSDEQQDVLETTAFETTETAPPTQAQLYDDLRRIGQLEDQKHAIQNEIDERTERLRNAIPTLDPDSLLHKMLSASMKPAAAKAAKTSRRPAKKKTSKKKATRKRGA